MIPEENNDDMDEYVPLPAELQAIFDSVLQDILANIQWPQLDLSALTAPMPLNLSLTTQVPALFTEPLQISPPPVTHTFLTQFLQDDKMTTGKNLAEEYLKDKGPKQY